MTNYPESGRSVWWAAAAGQPLGRAAGHLHKTMKCRKRPKRRDGQIYHEGPSINDVYTPLEGEGSWKSRHGKGGCINFILQISSKCGQGGGGQPI